MALPTTRPERRPHGRTIVGPDGVRAFLPAPLPPPRAWDNAVVAALSDADRAVGRLVGECRRLPHADLIAALFLRREAVLSSRIEGTRTTLAQLLAAETGAAPAPDPDDLHEVANCARAMEYGLARLETLPLSLRLVREFHERLMRGDSAMPGEFRRVRNWIGPPGSTPADAAYVPPPPEALMKCLDAWERFLHDDTLPPLVHAALAHAQFEAIHPFLDGNGRTGRLLIDLLLAARGVLPAPLLCLSAWFESTRDAYYAHLLAVTEKGEWEEWVEYFLRGVRIQAEDAVARIEAMEDLLERWREAASGRANDMLPLFLRHPFWTAGGLSERLGIAYTTARRRLDRLEEAGIIQPAGPAKRNRLWCARELLGILEAR